MCTRRSRLIGCSALAVGFLMAAPGHSWDIVNDVSYLTFNRPVATPGVTLAAGTYIFERAAGDTPSLVRVSSKDRRHVYLTTFTRPAMRPDGQRGPSVVVLGEAPRGEAPPITFWFPLGQILGYEFDYTR